MLWIEELAIVVRVKEENVPSLSLRTDDDGFKRF
jgi:hypothetical protein